MVSNGRLGMICVLSTVLVKNGCHVMSKMVGSLNLGCCYSCCSFFFGTAVLCKITPSLLPPAIVIPHRMMESLPAPDSRERSGGGCIGDSGRGGRGVIMMIDGDDDGDDDGEVCDSRDAVLTLSSLTSSLASWHHGCRRCPDRGWAHQADYSLRRKKHRLVCYLRPSAIVPKMSVT
ncbi:uncharacterized protein BO97DRAFT_94405 [Aspergillus homomorphus CBS 101889]|uniref:Uncharacterized protein n=1 Tax=Aspergillus homomorphus (strain CBS 101889) TaxID=1450537 RepID=A0A395HZQ5_ASPHC|nr:hypothetical protein BO97DRAFT_94405 [Aspergillus homomorphus CBS 101889]RAL11754.1 hypothetical protein BO97DRAFT_94405 [Aspergillus homomorphus CBS 101889]